MDCSQLYKSNHDDVICGNAVIGACLSYFANIFHTYDNDSGVRGHRAQKLCLSL